MARRLPSIAVLVGLTGLMPLGMHVLLPAIPSISADLAVPVSTVQWAVTLYMIAVGVSQLGYGPLSDQYGRRPLLLVGLGIFVLGAVVCALAHSATVLLIGRLIQGVGACTGIVLGRAMVRDVYPPNRAASVMAYVSMALMAFPGLAPIVGGFILEHSNWRMPFVATALCGVVLFAISLRLAETNTQPVKLPSLWAMVRDLVSLLRLPAFMVPALVSALSAAGFFPFLSVAPVMSQDLLHIPPERYGLYFIIVPAGFFLGSFLSTRILPRLGPERTVLYSVSAGVAICAVLVTLVLRGGLTPWTLFVPVSLVNVSWAVAQPALMVKAVGASPRLIGTASGLLGFLQMAFGAVGTQIIAHAYDRTALPAALILSGATVTAFAILVWRRGRL